MIKFIHSFSMQRVPSGQILCRYFIPLLTAHLERSNAGGIYFPPLLN